MSSDSPRKRRKQESEEGEGEEADYFDNGPSIVTQEEVDLEAGQFADTSWYYSNDSEVFPESEVANPLHETPPPESKEIEKSKKKKKEDAGSRGQVTKDSTEKIPIAVLYAHLIPSVLGDLELENPAKVKRIFDSVRNQKLISKEPLARLASLDRPYNHGKLLYTGVPNEPLHAPNASLPTTFRPPLISRLMYLLNGHIARKNYKGAVAVLRALFTKLQLAPTAFLTAYRSIVLNCDGSIKENFIKIYYLVINLFGSKRITYRLEMALVFAARGDYKSSYSMLKRFLSSKDFYSSPYLHAYCGMVQWMMWATDRDCPSSSQIASSFPISSARASTSESQARAHFEYLFKTFPTEAVPFLYPYSQVVLGVSSDADHDKFEQILLSLVLRDDVGPLPILYYYEFLKAFFPSDSLSQLVTLSALSMRDPVNKYVADSLVFLQTQFWRQPLHDRDVRLSKMLPQRAWEDEQASLEDRCVDMIIFISAGPLVYTQHQFEDWQLFHDVLTSLDEKFIPSVSPKAAKMPCWKELGSFWLSTLFTHPQVDARRSKTLYSLKKECVALIYGSTCSYLTYS